MTFACISWIFLTGASDLEETHVSPLYNSAGYFFFFLCCVCSWYYLVSSHPDFRVILKSILICLLPDPDKSQSWICLVLSALVPPRAFSAFNSCLSRQPIFHTIARVNFLKPQTPMCFLKHLIIFPFHRIKSKSLGILKCLFLKEHLRFHRAHSWMFVLAL